MEIHLKTHQGLYRRQFALSLISMTMATLLSRCADSGEIGLENGVFLQSR